MPELRGRGACGSARVAGISGRPASWRGAADSCHENSPYSRRDGDRGSFYGAKARSGWVGRRQDWPSVSSHCKARFTMSLRWLIIWKYSERSQTL